MQVKYLVRISLPDEGWDVNMRRKLVGRQAEKLVRGSFYQLWSNEMKRWWL